MFPQPKKERKDGGKEGRMEEEGGRKERKKKGREGKVKQFTTLEEKNKKIFSIDVRKRT